MKICKNLVTALKLAVDYIRDNPDTAITSCLQTLLADMWWPHQQISLEAMAELERADFMASDETLREFAYGVHCGPSNTWSFCEDPFAHLQDVVQRSQKGCHVMNKPT